MATQEQILLDRQLRDSPPPMSDPFSPLPYKEPSAINEQDVLAICGKLYLAGIAVAYTITTVRRESLLTGDEVDLSGKQAAHAFREALKLNTVQARQNFIEQSLQVEEGEPEAAISNRPLRLSTLYSKVNGWLDLLRQYNTSLEAAADNSRGHGVLRWRGTRDSMITNRPNSTYEPDIEAPSGDSFRRISLDPQTFDARNIGDELTMKVKVSSAFRSLIRFIQIEERSGRLLIDTVEKEIAEVFPRKELVLSGVLADAIGGVTLRAYSIASVAEWAVEPDLVLKQALEGAELKEMKAELGYLKAVYDRLAVMEARDGYEAGRYDLRRNHSIGVEHRAGQYHSHCVRVEETLKSMTKRQIKRYPGGVGRK